MQLIQVVLLFAMVGNAFSDEAQPCTEETCKVHKGDASGVEDQSLVSSAIPVVHTRDSKSLLQIEQKNHVTDLTVADELVDTDSGGNCHGKILIDVHRFLGPDKEERWADCQNQDPPCGYVTIKKIKSMVRGTGHYHGIDVDVKAWHNQTTEFDITFPRACSKRRKFVVEWLCEGECKTVFKSNNDAEVTCDAKWGGNSDLCYSKNTEFWDAPDGVFNLGFLGVGCQNAADIACPCSTTFAGNCPR